MLVCAERCAVRVQGKFFHSTGLAVNVSGQNSFPWMVRDKTLQKLQCTECLEISMKYPSILSTVPETFSSWNEHEAPRVGAALAFYTILSLAPLVILVIAIVALFL